MIFRWTGECCVELNCLCGMCVCMCALCWIEIKWKQNRLSHWRKKLFFSKIKILKNLICCSWAVEKPEFMHKHKVIKFHLAGIFLYIFTQNVLETNNRGACANNMFYFYFRMERDADFLHKKAERATLRVCLREKYRLPKVKSF